MLISTIAFLAASMSLAHGEEKNLVPNGGLEEGKGDPAHWDRVDGLCTFWVEDPIRGGKCLKCDSDVLASEYRARQEEMKQPNPPPAKKKTPVKPPGYDAVGGIEGVTYWSEWIDVKPRMKYRLTLDYRTDKGQEGLTPKVFVKGYQEVREKVFEDGKTVEKPFRRVFWKMYKDCKDSLANWQTATLEFNPSRGKPDVKWMRVMVFAYWPRGTCYFDNFKIVELGEEAVDPKAAPPDPGDDAPKEGPADEDGPEVIPPK